MGSVNGKTMILNGQKINGKTMDFILLIHTKYIYHSQI